MATAKTSRIKDPAVNIESAIMAIREVLMEYFKGTSVLTVTTGGPYLDPIGYDDRGFQYERHERERKHVCMLMLGKVPLLRVEKCQDAVTFNSHLLQRSPQLRAVQKGVEKFLKTYLVGVEIKYNEGGVYATG